MTVWHYLGIAIFAFSFLRTLFIIENRRYRLIKLIILLISIAVSYLWLLDKRKGLYVFILAFINLFLMLPSWIIFYLVRLKEKMKRASYSFIIPKYKDLQVMFKEKYNIDMSKSALKKFYNAFSFKDEQKNNCIILFPAIVENLKLSEIKFIAAHEMAHFELGHLDLPAIKKVIKWFGRIFNWVVGGPLAGVLYEVISKPVDRYLERSEEYTADRYAVMLLLENGHSPIGALEFFSRMSVIEENIPWYRKLYYSIYGTHPDSNKRFNKVKETLEEVLQETSS